MSDFPAIHHILLLAASAALFAAAGGVALVRLAADRGWTQPALVVLQAAGLVVGLGALLWHDIDRGNWLPLDNNFDSLAWIGLMLGGVALYLRVTRPIDGVDLFLMPTVVLLLAAAIGFGRWAPTEYHGQSLWHWTHRATTYAGAALFCVAGAVGGAYLIISARLRRKKAPPGTRMGNLERLERITRLSVTLGFALMTVGLVTGVARALDADGGTVMGDAWLLSPKVLLAACVWLVYAVVLHAPITPRLRGRKTATLSVLGFVLMVGTLVAVQFMPDS
ncbi:MAG: cytochrome c biogenesis protein CcsA [Phycisphaerae bacterium]